MEHGFVLYAPDLPQSGGGCSKPEQAVYLSRASTPRHTGRDGARGYVAWGCAGAALEPWEWEIEPNRARIRALHPRLTP